MQYTVRLLTHVLCKRTHFFFHSFIANMSFSLQTSFNSVMKDWTDKYHVWGTPTRDNSNTHFFILKRNIYMCFYIISVVYIYINLSYHILFEGVYFILSYFTHTWNAYVIVNLLKIKNTKNDACL